MKDCKCGRIPPCYSGKKFRIHEELEKIKAWDETHDMAYELNKQMCNLGKRLSDPLDPPSEETMKRACDVLEHHLKTMRELNRKSKLPIEVTEEHIKIINRFMEEKKTKKMTKAEAFEFLKHKKVAVTVDTIALQNKLFNIGYKWCDGSIVAMPMVDFLLIDDETFQFTESLSHFKNCAYEEINADDILSIEVVDEKSELEFNYDKVVELAKPLMAYLNEVGCSDGIRVSQFGIVHEPMSTLIFDNGIGE